MKKRKRKGMRENTNHSKMKEEIYEYDDITFRFDDKELQKEYVEQLEKYKKYEFAFRRDKVGNLEAISVVRGSVSRQLEKIEKDYDMGKDENGKSKSFKDANYIGGSRHKLDMFEKVRDDFNGGIYKQTDKIVEYFDLVKTETELFNAAHPDGKYSKSSTTLRYNVVWYDKTSEGKRAPV